MDEPKKPKPKLKKIIGWGSALTGTAAIGYIEGLGAGNVIGAQITKQISEGNLTQSLILFGIFVLLWLEMHGLKNAVKGLSATIASGFAAGEDRFSKIENLQNVSANEISKMRERIFALENQQRGHFGN